jgi:hypothetical protein
VTSSPSLLEREWVSIRDPEDDHRLYTFDVSFLLSGYRCIYGAGCPGITDEERPDLGCCVHGAYLNDDDDAEELQRLVDEELSPQLMQHHRKARRRGVTRVDEDDETHTRTVKDACIFLNRAEFDGPTGCALHHLAVSRGEHHMTHKPTVCWQLPLHRTIDERTANDGETLEVHTIAAFERGHWGDGGADFGWYCTEEPAAFPGETPLYLDMEHEIRAMVGDVVYEALADHLAARRERGGVVRFLPLAGA